MYQALYRQYRPKIFDEVLGQNHITITLKNQIRNENIGHAYLFSGTRGTGKTSTAKIFSRAVNCLDLQDGNPCNQCEICKGIIDESIMDVIEMDAASNRRIDDIRDLREKVVYPPTRAKYKVYIIDEVHMLTQEAFNALLKTLEEPPRHLIFILATTEPEKLPQTILSRCQRFDFKRVSTRDIIRNMKDILGKLNISIDEKVLKLIARNSDGAMRDSLSLLDQCISFKDDNIKYEDAIEILGITNNDKIVDLSTSLIENDLEKSLSRIDEIIQDGKDINQFIKDIISHFRNLMIVKTSKNPKDLIEIEEETMERYLRDTKDITLDFILRALDILTIADEKAKWSTQPRIILEMATIQIVNLDQTISLEERVKRLEMGISNSDQNIKKENLEYKNQENTHQDTHIKRKSEERLENQTNVVYKEKKQEENPTLNEDENIKGNVSHSENKNIEFSSVKNNWEDIIGKIKKEKMNIYALLIEGKPISLENNMLTIGYKEPYGFHKEAVNSPQNKEFVEKMLTSYYGTNISISLVMEREGVKSSEDEKKNINKSIKKVTDFFGEDIVEIK